MILQWFSVDFRVILNEFFKWFHQEMTNPGVTPIVGLPMSSWWLPGLSSDSMQTNCEPPWNQMARCFSAGHLVGQPNAFGHCRTRTHFSKSSASFGTMWVRFRHLPARAAPPATTPLFCSLTLPPQCSVQRLCLIAQCGFSLSETEKKSGKKEVTFWRNRHF